MTDNSSQEAETTREEAIEKLIELSAQNNNDFECYAKYFSAAIQGDREYSYLTWLKDDRFSPHVKLAIYIELFSFSLYLDAENRLDHAQADQDLFDYLCDYLNEKSYRPYREMLNTFLELMGRIMSFDYPTKTCKMIVDIVQNPEKYNKTQVCCGLDVFHYSSYRFEITWSNSEQFYKDMAEKWEKIILETDDEDICIDGLYYVLEKGTFEPSKYRAFVKKLWDKHPHDRVSVAIYKEYLKPSIILLAFNNLEILRKYHANLDPEVLRRFSHVVSSSQFLHSIDFDLNNELIQFCISNEETLKYFVEGMDDNYYDEGYYKIIDIVLSIYLSVESLSEIKIICLNIMIKNVRNHNYLKRKPYTFNTYLNMLDTYVEKITNKYTSNLKDSIIKLRCAQALALLFAYFKIHNDVKKKVMDSILLILTEKAKFSTGNAAVKHIMLYTYLSMLKTPIKYQEIQKLLEKMKDIPELYESYLLILYHVLLTFKCSEDKLNFLLSVVVQHKHVKNTRIHALTQVLNDKLADFCKRKHFKNVELLQREVNSASNESELGPDCVFLKSLNPFSGISLEIILCLIPKLNEIDTDEWKNNMEYSYFCIEPKSKLKLMVDNFQTSVDEFLSNKKHIFDKQ